MVKQMVKEASSGGSYGLFSKLFVYRSGKFDEYRGVPNSY
jgi:hypothetical protein